MPLSKKRKKPARTSNPTGRRSPDKSSTLKPSPMRRRETDEQLAERGRAEFVAIAETEGHLFPSPAAHTSFGLPVECWTNAWRYAETHGLDYAEGIALMPDGWHAHAWCVTADGTVLDPTINYEHATEYRGWTFNPEGRHAINALYDGTPRTSFLENGLASGVATWQQIRDRFLNPMPPPPTAS